MELLNLYVKLQVKLGLDCGRKIAFCFSGVLEVFPPYRKACLVFPLSYKTSLVIRGCYCSESVGAQVTCVCEDVAQICSWLSQESQDICQQALIKPWNDGDLVRRNVLSVLPHWNRQSTQPDPKCWKIPAEIIHAKNSCWNHPCRSCGCP